MRVAHAIGIAVIILSLPVAGRGEANEPAEPVQKLPHRVIMQEEGRHIGRVATEVTADGLWLLAYRNASHHWRHNDGQLHLIFSDDRGETWSEPDRLPDGTAVEGFPAAPPGAGPEEPTGPGEPWLYRAPDGTLIMHSWFVDYGEYETSRGTWQITSEDNGRSWSAWRQVDFRGIEDDDRVFATDDHFVLDGTIYAGARQLVGSRWKNMLIRSDDNGESWHKVSDITTPEDNSSEVGLEYLGDGRIVAVLNHKDRDTTYRTFSDDLGQTWQRAERIHSQTAIWDRCRLWSIRHLKGDRPWWPDSLLLGVGDQAMERGESMPRRNALWFSRDGGASWQGPIGLDAVTKDAGYGDVLYDPESETFHFYSYHGSSDETALVDYPFRLRD